MSRIKRLEFSKDVRVEIFRRAGGPGDLRCEGCGLSLKNKPFEVDHTIEEWEREDVAHGLRPALTAADGKLLGRCCHKPKTAQKSAERAHVTAIIEKAAGARRARSPMPFGRGSAKKKRMDGTVVWRDSGEPVR